MMRRSNTQVMVLCEFARLGMREGWTFSKRNGNQVREWRLIVDTFGRARHRSGDEQERESNQA